MVSTKGLIGLRPTPESVGRFTSPPYDVIKPGTPLERILKSEPDSIVHVILGDHPKDSLNDLHRRGIVERDDEPAFYAYQQRSAFGTRIGVLAAAGVHPYEDGKVLRHEKTFDHKVTGRLKLREATGHSFGPVFCLTRANISRILEEAISKDAVWAFESDFQNESELHEVENRIVRIPEASELGNALIKALEPEAFYIADGHHRYHASLRNNQTHFLAYITEHAEIQAYNRVVRCDRPFEDVRDSLRLIPTEQFRTPEKHQFCLYTREGCFTLAAEVIPSDVVGRLDCAILERELYPKLGITSEKIRDAGYFDYYPESNLEQMVRVVDRGDFDVAIALHPVGRDELFAVADAGLTDSEIVMPQKSTYFAPKILTGLFMYRHQVNR
ncbi:MAG: DUF1015 family protein [Myxococcota bacterium]